MDPRDAIGAKIVQLRRELERLEAAARLLDGAAPDEPELPGLPPLPPAKLAVMTALTAAGARGMRRSELVKAVPNFAAGTIVQVLHLLKKDGLVTLGEGRIWRRA